MDPLTQHALRPGADRRLDALHQRFRALSAPWRRWQRLRFWLGPTLAGLVLGYGAVAFYDLSVKYDSVAVAARHVAAAPNCDAARAQGLAPAYRGAPGYYPWHDADNDGIACEPWPT